MCSRNILKKNECCRLVWAALSLGSVRNGIYLHALLLLLSLQSCPTRCNPRDGSPPGSPVPGILQARTLEWVSISFSNAWKWKVKGKLLSHVRLFATPWTAAYQAPPCMGFSRQEYWSGVPLPSPNLHALASCFGLLSMSLAWHVQQWHSNRAGSQAPLALDQRGLSHLCS